MPIWLCLLSEPNRVGMDEIQGLKKVTRTFGWVYLNQEHDVLHFAV